MVAPVADRTPAMMIPATAVQPAAVMPEAYAKDAIISWFRGEFAAANAIIDALCGHLSQLEGGRCEYEAVFAAIHRRRLNWIPILQMQKFFSIADVTVELEKVAEKVKVPVVEMKREIVVEEPVEIMDVNGGGEVVDDDLFKDYSPKSGITDAGSQEVNSAAESIEVCSNQEDWEARRAEMKLTKGFAAKESVKGHMVNVVRGLKLYEDILNATELSKLTDYVTELRIAGQNGELSGETFIMYNQQSKAIKRELIQFGAPIFGQIKDDQASNIDPIPAPLEAIIDHLIQLHLISENRRPNSCIINFFDEGEFSQPFLKPPHLEQPISTIVLSESTMAFGRSLVCDNEGNYKGPLMLSLKEGSLLVMRGNSADMARHAMSQSPTKRISITFFKVRIDKSPPSKDPMAGAMTVWQPSLPTGDLVHVLPKWGAIRAPQLLMLAPVPPMVMSPRRLPRGGTGVFLPWNNGSKKQTKHLPPRAQRGRLLALSAPTEPHKINKTPDSVISVA
ncbi:putative alpha-ketoglutarate-dependent dioxygenase AlkB-like superfamily [Helianthus annuus]|uniref:Alpha-ketoglutarate-dependent dioxygenase AlkB-like superfamily n=1 Tax=Helianthus annuus TaxID=4232 RepID=A0A251SEZ0_HELAN|nr:RNA demethylase ALKBH10B [Helianthus annuus]XP_022008826.1 RNA demethylase ALKBH10B [Helianthus annuus]KAF5782610.1 putative alpha-ketoglutarate-dependent dioxygenase AlkB-like superfamily [Helianthus annuus]KAJ0502081.1 putative alpha-ketoglutarate-dependent dioxygenase AlkB-like superfamily [Helianthus annuus]KAJ0510046.1 putative alpha-ketoglutarate-dependent dioxygenase AlkB-like superfamily [Helianthus annuus]KAJ0686025.1 putative alpha-ketoglutarate-dependent dioxygenase AlkB-like sup